jgi:hypothetical protein
MLFTSLIALFVAFLAAEENPAPALSKATFVAEAIEGLDGCGTGKPTCLNPVIHYQNYQDINVDVIEYYNFETSFPMIGYDNNTWTITNEGYTDGFFQIFSGSPIFMNRVSPLLLEGQEVTYISAQLEYTMFDDPEEITSPLGAEGDPFYAAAFFTVYDDVDTGLEYGFALTNTTVYAIYSRSNVTQTPENNYRAFSYLVPIQTVRPNSIYTFILNKADGSVSWMIDGTIRMVIPISGKLIDERFMINDQGGLYQHAAFPDAVYISIGGNRIYTGIPHTACQDAIFQYCDRSQNIFHADNVQCVYEPIQDYGTYSIYAQLLWSMFSITQATAMKPACNCPC